MKARFLISLLLGSATVVYCQTSAYQDASGTSSIYIANAKANLTYNVSDAKFTIGYFYEPSGDRADDIRGQLAKAKDKLITLQALAKDAMQKSASLDVQTEYQKRIADTQQEILKLTVDLANVKHQGACGSCEFGASFFGKPSTDLTGQLLQTSSSPADVGGGGSFGRHGVFSKDIFQLGPNDHLQDDWFLVNVSYDRSTFDTVATGSSSPIVQHFNGFTVLPVYNAWTSFPAFTLLAGVGAGVSRTNNSADLKKVQISTTQASSGSVSVVSQTSAYLGKYAVSYSAPVYSDFVFIPKPVSWLGIDLFERANVLSTNGYAEGGVGLFFAKPSNPAAVLGGISIGWKNGDPTVAIVAGWTF